MRRMDIANKALPIYFVLVCPDSRWNPTSLHRCFDRHCCSELKVVETKEFAGKDGILRPAMKFSRQAVQFRSSPNVQAKWRIQSNEKRRKVGIYFKSDTIDNKNKSCFRPRPRIHRQNYGDRRTWCWGSPTDTTEPKFPRRKSRPRFGGWPRYIIRIWIPTTCLWRNANLWWASWSRPMSV